MAVRDSNKKSKRSPNWLNVISRFDSANQTIHQANDKSLSKQQQNYKNQIMNQASNKDNSPKFTYWHVWTDEDGVSHQTQCQLTNFEKESMSGDAAAQWNNRLLTANSKIIFAELPVGWVGEWHENPQPQWIIPLSGKWFVETMDRVRVEMGAGEISFGGDQNTKPNAEGLQGHLSGTVGNEPCKMAIVQLDGDEWLGLHPGEFN